MHCTLLVFIENMVIFSVHQLRVCKEVLKLPVPETRPITVKTSPVDGDFLCHVTNSTHLIVGPSLPLDQRLGIRCRLTSVIRCVVTSLSDVH